MVIRTVVNCIQNFLGEPNHKVHILVFLWMSTVNSGNFLKILLFTKWYLILASLSSIFQRKIFATFLLATISARKVYQDFQILLLTVFLATRFAKPELPVLAKYVNDNLYVCIEKIVIFCLKPCEWKLV